MEHVIILHGLGRSTASMERLADRVGTAGFQTHLVDYPSSKGTIENLVEQVFPSLPSVPQKLHFVGHSLGGILAKKLALKLPDTRRGRIVQIGTPNFGSKIAERAAIFGALMGPALSELTPNSGIDDSGLDIGAIAGTAAISAYGLITGIKGDNDGKVSVISAWGNAPADKRIAFPVAHSIMMQDARVIAATTRFLKTGGFSR
ncbi:MAG: thioesterase domain-containing protein [Paracoccaceae bacterium]